MGNILPPDIPIIVDDTLYIACGYIQQCSQTGEYPDSEPVWICYAMYGAHIKSWFFDGYNSSCGHLPSGSVLVDWKFTIVSITIF